MDEDIKKGLYVLACVLIAMAVIVYIGFEKGDKVFGMLMGGTIIVSAAILYFLGGAIFAGLAAAFCFLIAWLMERIGRILIPILFAAAVLLIIICIIDSINNSTAGRYKQAVRRYNNREYEDALRIFNSLPDGFRDRDSYLEKSIDGCYDRAVTEYKNEKYREAFDKFKKIMNLREDYKNAAEYYNSSLIMKETEFGGKFGSGDYSAKRDGSKEPISWDVVPLSKTKTSDRVLLVATGAIDVKPFDEAGRDCSWKDSSLRKWLNGPFLEEVFGDTVFGDSILRTQLPGYTDSSLSKADSSNACIDKIFILSKEEHLKYFGNENVPATPYAIAEGAEVKKVTVMENITYSDLTYVWLRKDWDGGDDPLVLKPAKNPEFIHVSSGNRKVGVRPAMYIKIPKI